MVGEEGQALAIMVFLRELEESAQAWIDLL